ncbi:MAG: FAD:protein FMN transferase [Candidatus Limnocylindrales bacterium]
MANATIARFVARAMGSALRLTVCVDDRAERASAAASAWAEVVDEFERSEQALSRFRDTSELTWLNRAVGTGCAVDVTRRLERAVIAADRAHRVTGGRFDPRVLADLDRLGYRGAALPWQTTAAGSRDGWSRHPDDRIVRRPAPGRIRIDRPIDLGGIGKGLALRWAAALLDRHGIGSFLLEAGGDLVARGQGPEAGDWRVGIEDPSGAETPLAVIAAGDLAVTTSSVGVHAWFVDGRPAHHLIDPATGQPGGDGLLAVTVAGQDPAWAEVWSKTLFLAGRAGIAALARSRGLAAWWIGADQSLEMTPAARLRTIWVAAEA